jgi:hypothetical protein
MHMVKVMTGSNAFILTSANADQPVETPNINGREFRLTLTVHWEEYRDPSQPAGSLWLEYQLGTTTPSLPGIEAVVPIVLAAPEDCKTFLIVTRGDVDIHYNGQAKAHVWLSYYAEYVE